MATEVTVTSVDTPSNRQHLCDVLTAYQSVWFKQQEPRKSVVLRNRKRVAIFL